ncbi:hypothetical protein [Xylanibacter ruminicola]|jgi:predicted proteasome-type protease|uniref:Uncharacterized protein n=1 Tax=Xylanibacter ruminicola TaxID=839 RepID=A0A1M6T4T9_XYLRU|nr:hypothetical protein [Xylanibacter ruminicola]SHK51916.1 hypothetical protein SAMN05216463_1055 [Xylanibacter ruminicola]
MKKNVVMRNIAEGNRIYQEMKKSMLSVEPTIGSLVSMNYALSKLLANYKLAMQKLDIDVDAYLADMTKWWENQLECGEADDQEDFDAFAYTVDRLAEA